MNPKTIKLRGGPADGSTVTVHDHSDILVYTLVKTAAPLAHRKWQVAEVVVHVYDCEGRHISSQVQETPSTDLIKTLDHL